MNDPKGGRFGRYEILTELGRGAMGVVYQGRDPKINRVVAVKTISLAGQPPEEEQEYRQRFYREAEAAGRMSHPGIVTIFDVGEDMETGTPYIVMEFVGGQSLDKQLARGDRKLPQEAALQLTLELADALDYAHSQGVVHRDLKPSNILITEDGHAKIADFGVAKLNLANYTLAGRVLGTPAYMSPEQLNGDEVDGRSDLFSLGVILYTIVTGYRPFQGNSALTVSFKVVNREPVPATVLDTDLPLGLDYIIGRAMAKDPAQRYQRGVEMMQDIQALREGRDPRSNANQTGAMAAGVGVQNAKDGTSSGLTALGTGARPRISRRASPKGERPSDILLQTLRNKFVAGALLLVGLLVFGLRISHVLRPHAAAQKNPPVATAAKVVPHAEEIAQPKPKEEITPKVIKPRKALTRISPPSAKVAAAGSKPSLQPAPSPASPPSSPASPAMLEIEVEHKFADARLSIWIDESLTYTLTLEGIDKKHLVVFHQVQGHEFHAMQVTPGKHLLRVQVTPGVAKDAQSDTVTGEFVSGKEKMLHIRFGKQGKMELSLE
jgi:serine/threonine protein kinase